MTGAAQPFGDADLESNAISTEIESTDRPAVDEATALGDDASAPVASTTGADPVDPVDVAEGRHVETVEEILDDIERVTEERDGYLADLQRVTAEFANYRKQTERRHGDLVAQAASGLAEALLPVLDACDAAVLQGVEGVAPIHGQLLAVLEQQGLEVIGGTDEPFDPNQHEAVMTEPPSDDDDPAAGPVVAEVLRTGYAWRGRVFRPAMVKVRG